MKLDRAAIRDVRGLAALLSGNGVDVATVVDTKYTPLTDTWWVRFRDVVSLQECLARLVQAGFSAAAANNDLVEQAAEGRAEPTA
eukprot:10882519-Prorocentrum_lima.AAC.1